MRGDHVPGMPGHIIATHLNPQTAGQIRSSLHLVDALLVSTLRVRNMDSR